MKAKEFFGRVRWGTFVSSLLTIIVGILLVALPESSSRILCVIVGVLFLLSGIFGIAGYFVRRISDMSDFVLGFVQIALALWLFIAPGSALKVLMVVFGVLLLLRSFAGAGHAMESYRHNAKYWWTGLIVSLLTLVLAIIVLCNPFETLRVLMIVAGIAFIYDGDVRHVPHGERDEAFRAKEQAGRNDGDRRGSRRRRGQINAEDRDGACAPPLLCAQRLAPRIRIPRTRAKE